VFIFTLSDRDTFREHVKSVFENLIPVQCKPSQRPTVDEELPSTSKQSEEFASTSTLNTAGQGMLNDSTQSLPVSPPQGKLCPLPGSAPASPRSPRFHSCSNPQRPNRMPRSDSAPRLAGLAQSQTFPVSVINSEEEFQSLSNADQLGNILGERPFLRRVQTVPATIADLEPISGELANPNPQDTNESSSSSKSSKQPAGPNNTSSETLQEPASPTIFRVRGIPLDCANGGTRHLIRKVLSLQDSARIHTRSLAVSPSQESMTAVVSFEIVPVSLSPHEFLNKTERKFPIPVDIPNDNDDSVEGLKYITFDTHFNNLTILRSLANSNEHEIEYVSLVTRSSMCMLLMNLASAP
jgi:hypothetical protein